MATDARLSTELPNHPKTLKLIRRLGQAAAWNLTRLFLWAAANRPDGDLAGMTDEDIELTIDWLGEAGAFVRECVDLRFLEGEEEERRIHDWEVHNPWAAGADMRSAKARWNSVKRHHGEAEANRKVPEYAAVRSANSNASSSPGSNAGSNTNDPGSNAEDATRTKKAPSSNAPSPSPYPSPYPSHIPSPSPSDAELQGSFDAAASPTVVEILCADKSLYPVTEVQVESWRSAFPGVNIPAALQRIRVWAEANPKRRKTRKGMPRFITDWLGRDQDSGRSQTSQFPPLRGRTAGRHSGFDQTNYREGVDENGRIVA